MITVPGAITSSFGYFCFIERESFPVGMLIPNSMAKLDTASTALYKRASSPLFLQGHIQFAERDTDSSWFSKGAHTKLVKDSAMALREPAASSIKLAMGACPMLVATPSFPLKSKAMTATSFKGNCKGPAHCCLATLPPTQRSTLLVNQSLHATASNCKTFSKYSCTNSCV